VNELMEQYRAIVMRMVAMECGLCRSGLMLFYNGNVICDGTTILHASLHSDGNFDARPVEII